LTTLSEIISFIGTNGDVNCNEKNLKIIGFKPITSAKSAEMSFYSNNDEKAFDIISSSNASVILCDRKLKETLKNLDQNLIFVNNPRLWFFRCVKRFSNTERPLGIHPTAVVESEINGKNIFVGPHTFVGKNVTVGDNTVIFGNVSVYENTSIGKNVTIKAGSVIGSRGFGYEIDENNNVETFHHIGGVEIHDDVEIGANVCIDKGSLENTVIGERSIIDNLVHVSHNVKIGKDVQVVALTMLGGSAILEDNCLIAMSSTLRDHVRIGRNSIVGLGSVVTKDVKSNSTVYGNPAYSH